MISIPKSTRILFVITCAFVLLDLIINYLPLKNCLIISDVDNPGNMLVLDAKVDDVFIVSYTHSVNKGRVKDYYKILPDKSLSVEKTVFVSYGAGIPEPEENQEFVINDSGIEIQNINRQMKSLRMAVGVEAKHAIECNDKVFVLADFFEPQTSLNVECNRVSLTQYNKINKNMEAKNGR